MADPGPTNSGTSGLEAFAGPLNPADQATVNAGKVAAGGSGKPIAYVPWWGINRGRAKDIENNDNNPRTPAYVDYNEALAGAKGEKVHGESKTPITIPYAEMGTEEAFGYGAKPLTEAQIKQQADRGEASKQIMKNAEEVYLDPYNWTKEQLASVGAEMISVGLLDDGPYSMPDFLAAWVKLVGQAVDYKTAKPDSLFTPLDMLDINYRNVAGDSLGPQAVTTISKSQSISTNDDARYMLSNMMTRELGRRPTAKEVDDFQSNLNSAQRANPRTTTTTSTPGSLTKSGMNETYSNTTGGVNEQQRAEDFVISDDPDSEYGRYQAATTYANALFAAIRSPV